MIFSLLLASQTLTVALVPPPEINIACPCAKNWEAEVSVPRFDAALGTLTSARITVVVREPRSAGAAMLAENTRPTFVLAPEATAWVCAPLLFASDRSWVYNSSQSYVYGSEIGHPWPSVTDRFHRARYLAPFDGALDYLGESAGGLCFPSCGPITFSTQIAPHQLDRFVGIGTEKLVWMPRMGWWANKAAERLAWARSLPIEPVYSEIEYTYEPTP